MPVDTLFLLCLKDMDDLRIELHNLSNELVSKEKKLKVPVVRRFGHPWLAWNETLQTFLLETWRIHRRFGGPSADRLYKVLEQAGHDTDRAQID
jgi:hypothetical protein